jgi:hypothetical protein
VQKDTKVDALQGMVRARLAVPAGGLLGDVLLLRPSKFTRVTKEFGCQGGDWQVLLSEWFVLWPAHPERWLRPPLFGATQKGDGTGRRSIYRNTTFEDENFILRVRCVHATRGNHCDSTRGNHCDCT